MPRAGSCAQPHVALETVERGSPRPARADAAAKEAPKEAPKEEAPKEAAPKPTPFGALKALSGELGVPKRDRDQITTIVKAQILRGRAPTADRTEGDARGAGTGLGSDVVVVSQLT